MKYELSSEEELKHHLLNIQVVARNGGLVIRRGTVRCYIQGDGLESALSVLADHACNPEGVAIDRLVAEQPVESRKPLQQLAEILKARRLLVPASDVAPANHHGVEHEEVFYWNYGTSKAVVEKNLLEKEVTIVGVNTISLPLASLLRQSGIPTVTLVDHPLFRHLSLFNDDGDPLDPGTTKGAASFTEWAESEQTPEFLIVVSDFGGLSLMREWNEFAVQRSIPFLPLVLQAGRIYVGPLVMPGESPCFECYWLRQNSNMDKPLLERATESSAFLNQRVEGFLPAMSLCAASVAAMEVIKFLSQTLPGGNVGRAIEIDLMEPQTTRRKVLKLPRCPVCSRPARRPAPAADITVFMPGNEP